MKRTFIDIDPDQGKEKHSQRKYVGPGFGDSNWDELLKSDRVLIVAEAGSGKTHECQLRQRELWSQGHAAFFIELAQLADCNDIKYLMGPEEIERFERWAQSPSETATFFLDSYDELKLTLKSFDRALTTLGRGLSGGLNRVKVILTSRPIPVDRKMFKDRLPLPPKIENSPNKKSFADLATFGPEQPKSKTKGPEPWRSVELLPLTDAQIVEVATECGVSEGAALLSEIKQRNAEEFARRPQDLIELCAAWKTRGALSRHRDQVEDNIAIKLSPSDLRAERTPLSPERCREGASRLALASLLSRKLSLRHSASADVEGNLESLLNPSTILADWQPNECQTLLERSLFGFASYGCVRFHHRSVIEYLAAEQIKSLIGKGISKKAVMRLLFATTPYGDPIVRPSMRPVAAWLALNDQDIFYEVLRREPEVLLNFGDPESLDYSRRAAILDRFVERFGGGSWRGLQTPHIQLHRFSSPDLAPDIQRLWLKGVENSEVRELLLGLIETGRISACADICYSAATTATAEDSERLAAIDALAAIDDQRLAELLDRMTADVRNWPVSLITWAAIRLFPGKIPVAVLFSIIRRVPSGDKALIKIADRLTWEIKSGQVDRSYLIALREGLEQLIRENGLVLEHHWEPLVSARAALAPLLASVCLELITKYTPDIETLRSTVTALRTYDTSSHGSQTIGALKGALASMPGRFRHQIFQIDDALLQALDPCTDSRERVSRLQHRGCFRITAEKDRDWVLEKLRNSAETIDTRQLYLEAARYLLDESMECSVFLNSLKPLVVDAPTLTSRIDEWLQPARLDPAIAAMQAKHEQQEIEAQQKRAEVHASWVQFQRELTDHPDIAFAEDRVEGTVWNLWKVMRSVNERKLSGGWNRHLIEEHFGKAVADRVRTALIPMWRSEIPTLTCERDIADRNITLIRWAFRLAAISAEAEDLDWAKELSNDEAKLATRYALLEMGRFPGWLDGLAETHPNAVREVIIADLLFELDAHNQIAHALTLQAIENSSPAVIALFIDCLDQWLAQSAQRWMDDSVTPLPIPTLTQVVRVLLAYGSQAVRERLAHTAATILDKSTDFESLALWLPVVCNQDIDSGIVRVVGILENLPVESQVGLGQRLIGCLFGRRYDMMGINLDRCSPPRLLDLLRQAYRHIRREDDAEHGDSYPQDDRDHAETGRSMILNALLIARGPAAWGAKQALAQDPLFQHFQDRARALALEQAAEEADEAIYSPEEIARCTGNNELAPHSREDMLALLRDRLDDINAIFLRDDSPRAAWQKTTKERDMRQLLTHELNGLKRGAYTVDQEAVTADEKETDIRLRSTNSHQQAVIELKIGEQPRSAKELRETLHDQLLKKYLAADDCRVGCLLITVATDKSWKHPDTGVPLDFNGLIDMLNLEAVAIEQRLMGEVRIFARGLDLRPRLVAERRTA